MYIHQPEKNTVTDENYIAFSHHHMMAKINNKKKNFGMNLAFFDELIVSIAFA